MRTAQRVLMAFGLITALLFVGTPAQAMTDGSAVINEIHYKPSGADEDPREFIELHNPGTEPFALDGVAFTDGITTAALDGLVIPGEGYFVLAPTVNTMFETYGITPDATYDGGLKNSTETVELSQGATVIDSVTYADRGDWPTSPDGNGPSLELADPHADNDDYANWHASDGDPTPGALNTVPVVPTSFITDVAASPTAPGDGEDVTISATIDGATAATVEYRIGFEPAMTVPMVAGVDAQFTAVIPGQEAGELIRYRVDVSATVSDPAHDDTINYHGLVVADPTVTTGGAPIFEWFMEDADLQTLLADTLNDELSFPAVIAYNGTVYDNVDVEIQGGDPARKNHPKQSFDFHMPNGHDFVAPGLLAYPVDEFAIKSSWPDGTFGRAGSSWWMMGQAGNPVVHSFEMRVQNNGDFYGLYIFQEKLDGTWRKANDLDSGDFYKAGAGGFTKDSGAGFEKKSPDDGDVAAIGALSAMVRSPASATKTAYLYDTFDIPSLINWNAGVAVVGHDDTRKKNFFVYYDAGDTERWSLLQWDLDLTFGHDVKGCRASVSTDIACAGVPQATAVYQSPELDAMFWARVRTLVDEALVLPTLEELHETRTGLIGAETGALELGAWGRANPTTDFRKQLLYNQFEERRTAYANEPELPAPGNPTDVVISEIFASPDAGPEFLELTNIGDTPVDLSDWTIDAVLKDGETIPPGTVLLPGKRIVLTDSISGIDATYPGLPDVVLVQFNGGLAGSGEEITLVARDGSTADTVTYSDLGPWPTEPAAGFKTLERIDLAAGSNDPANWAASAVDGGTPGAENSAGPISPTTEVSVIARGEAGDEEVELVINDADPIPIVVGTTYETFTFQTTETVTDVRINYLNDRRFPVSRNLYVDAILIDGVRYESEAQSTESKGVFNSVTRCAVGFKQSEKLSCNGYFKYDIGQSVDPVAIDVIARGDTGEEQAEIVINGGAPIPLVVGTAYETHSFESANPVTTVRINYLNDKRIPVDRNLYVDAIDVDGVRYETEAPTTESRGVWNPDTRCGVGFKQSEKLSCNGYFDYVITN